MVEILEQRYIPIPVARRIMERFKELVEENPVMTRVYEYLVRFSKCDPESAEKAFEEIKSIGFTEFAAALLVNLAPRSLEEAKALLADIDGGYPDDKIEKAVEVLAKYCSGGSS